MQPRPGDLIYWVDSECVDVSKYETLWSTYEKKYVPIGTYYIHMCLACDGHSIMWMNIAGIFRACCTASIFKDTNAQSCRVYPMIRV